MFKGVLAIVILGLVGISGFFVLNNYIYEEKQADEVSSMTEDELRESSMMVEVTPISHATMVMRWRGFTIYTDPVGGADAFTGHPEPDLVLITDIHGDHLNAETVRAVATDRVVMVAPQAVANELPDDLPGVVVVLENGEVTEQDGFTITAVPMYNVPETSTAPHVKGRGNGYVVEVDETRVYIAGDTGPTEEMKALENIDIAFIPMNLPYTMSVDDAAEAVLAFAPQVVHPYHYRGPDGLSDVNRFKELVETGNSEILVELLDFYPGE